MAKHAPPSIHEVPQRVLDRFWSRVDVGAEDECWPWRLSLGSHGYGQIGWGAGAVNVGTTAHRIAWMVAYGPIPIGLTVDHRCRVRCCCNPRHLRLKTNADNARDNGNARKTHCPHGHPYSEANTRFTKKGHRRCLTCEKGRRAAAAETLFDPSIARVVLAALLEAQLPIPGDDDDCENGR